MRGRRSFIRLFVGFILTATGVRPCPIELSSPSVVVKHGGPVSINCSTWDSQVTEMGWEATQGGTGLQEVKHLTWAVDNLTDWNISPLCYINMLQNSSVTQCEKMLKVVLYTFPEDISISSDVDFNGGVFLLKEDEPRYFSCDINHVAPAHNLTVMWYEDNRLFYTENSQNSSKKPVDHSSVITYKMSRRQKNVKLRCEAHMDLGPEGPQLHVSSQEHELEVYFGPDVLCSHIALLEGESLESKCPVEGNPPPSVRWLRDGRLINWSLPLSREESGLYNIEAVGYSNITKPVQVAVMYKPELTCPRSYSTTEHAPNSITCTVRGYPEPKITWLKDGEEAALPGELTRSDAGHYVVIASNEVSSVNVSLYIVIVYPPSQIDELEDYEVELGSDVSLKCASVGNPRPEYLWTYYRAANVKELSEDGVSRLLVHNVTAHNVGSYTCHATNDYGHVSKTAALTVRGVTKECPLEIRPNRMAIQYQSHNPNVDCVVTSNDPRNIVNVSWEAATIRIIGKTWRVDTSRDWDLRPSCTASFLGIGTCQKSLDYTLYKTPDEVFLSSDVSLVVEDRPFQLRCDIINVAPARSLVVRWYQGNDIFETHVKGSLKMMDCPSENITSCNIGMVSSPVNVSSAISVTLNRTHRGEQFRCDVELNLEFEKPLPPLVMTSNPVTITVLSKPAINTTKLPKTIPVFRGYPEELVCEADGHPPPKIQWSYRSLNVSNNTITAVEAGLYNCTATNEVDSTFYVVEVVLKEDYLPLIAGFVAVTVVAISVVFLFIYSIYYKNTKMRRYSLKNPKLGNHNGNVAHNGWDLQFPMTKLS